MPTDPSPMMRMELGNLRGATAFFRNRPLLATIFDYLSRRDSGPLRVLFHASSVGAEPYSFVIHHDAAADRTWNFDLTVDATDISPDFLQFASRGIYDEKAISTLQPAERDCFEPVAPAKIRPIQEIRDRIRFLPASPFSEFSTDQTYDVVFLCNALVYVDAETQSKTFDRIGGYNNDLLVTTAFHPERIKADMIRNGYVPVVENIAKIHHGWGVRLQGTNQPMPDHGPGVLHTDYRLDAFAPIPDFEYKLCALFRKAPTTKFDGP